MLIRATVAAMAIAAPAFAEIETIAADGDVLTVFNRLETAVAEAGATIFARVDHRAGAESLDMELNDSMLLIFGNPRIGTPAMQDDMLAGLRLPLRMLVYSDGAQTWVAYEAVEDMFEGLQIDDDAEYLETMETVMGNFARTAAGN